jgi:hypothetical protein
MRVQRHPENASASGHSAVKNNKKLAVGKIQYPGVSEYIFI